MTSPTGEAETLRERRLRLGLTQEEVARGAKVSHATAWRLDSGARSDRSDAAERVVAYLDRVEAAVNDPATIRTDVDLAGLLESLDLDRLERFSEIALRLSQSADLDETEREMLEVLAEVSPRLALHGENPVLSLHQLAPSLFETSASDVSPSQSGRRE